MGVLFDVVIRGTQCWWRAEDGVTTIEYGLLAALVAVAVIGGVQASGTSLSALYTFWTSAVVAAL